MSDEHSKSGSVTSRRHGLLALTETFEKWMSEEPITDGEMYDALMAGIEIAKAATECESPCDLAPGGPKRQWCMAHSEWTPCPFKDLRSALNGNEQVNG